MTSVQPAPSTAYRLSDWQRGYESLETEHRYAITDIDGTIPAALRGTLFRNGPGRLGVNGDRFHHPFDGDGMICAVAFADGCAYFQNRYVRTEGFLAESAAGKILYRGVFGTQKPGGWLANAFDFRLKNIANTSILYWNQQLLALWEAGLPHALEPRTLETLGPTTLNGILRDNDAWSAHPRIDPNGGDPILVNFAIKPGLDTQVMVYEVAQDGTLLTQKTFSIPGFAFIHDFVITPHYYIFFQNPVTLNPIPYALGLRGAGQCIAFKPNQPTRIWLMPRQADGQVNGQVRVINTDPCFVFHHANAYEQGDRLIIDSICYENFPSLEPDVDFRTVDFSQVPAGQLWRFCVNPHTETVEDRQVLLSRCCEFPTLNPRQVGQPYSTLVIGAAHQAQGNAPLQALIKLDLETGEQSTWSAAPTGFMSEPLFVPHPDAQTEADGWVLCFVYDAAHHRTDVTILEAQQLEAGPVARLHLRHHIPYGLHGCFTPEVLQPEA